ncbi:TolC family protein [Desulfobotulus sp. H1]|uniref:TolC family protein n=1 Tax=Desulfobotulus pelophilus TaxID=2823377 RepID=A0ABT3N6C4_9BACT|nr:TolC family protein [Desulfobotulus pelophilus]MCW7753011.1 TolC family protein [Desulfobotulus pelophilus]
MQVFRTIVVLSGLICPLIIGCSLMKSSGSSIPMADNALSGLFDWSSLDGEIRTSILGDLIRSDSLKELVAEALDANPGLQQTLFTLQISMAEYRQASGERMPEVSAAYGVQREKDDGTSYTGSLTISWEADLWQRLADSRLAVEKDAAQQAALYQAARDTLGAEVMKTWLALAGAFDGIIIEEKRISTLEKRKMITEQRYRSGIATAEDLDRLRSSLASANADLEASMEKMAGHARTLTILLGRDRDEPFDFSEKEVVVLVPVADVPELSVGRRPDLKAAYLAIEADALRTRVAYKDLLPGIRLQAVLEDAASSPGSALMRDPVWSLLAQLTAPIFQGGRLRAAVEIAELTEARSYEAYRETLLTAIYEVWEAAGVERSLTRQLVHMESALAALRNRLHHREKEYSSGLSDRLTLLEMQQEVDELTMEMNRLVYERLVNRIGLGLALGLGVDR